MSSENPPVIAVLGFGMAGRPIARGLADAGLPDVRVWKRKPWAREHLEAAGHPALRLTDRIEEAVSGAEIVFSLVRVEAALETARAAAASLGGAIYADLNTTVPDQMAEIGRIVEEAGGRPVDGAIVDPAEVYGHRVATTVSGPEAEALRARMAPWGMNLTVLSGRVGDASALKMVRSVFTKGLMMTFLEALEAGRRCGILEPLLDSIAGTVEGLPLRDLALSLAGTSLIVAERRASEMALVVDTLKGLGVDSRISAASLEKFRWLSRIGVREELEGLPPNSIEEALQALERALAGARADSSPAPGGAPPE